MKGPISLDELPEADISDSISELEINSERDVTGQSTSIGDVEHFVSCFRDRFEKMSRILQERGKHYIPIEHAKNRDVSCRVIGIVTSSRETTNGHRLISVEDLRDSMNALVPNRSKELLKYSENIVNDEVIALEGRGRNGLFIIDKIIQPDLPIKKPRFSKEDIHVAFLSDLHIGSKLFMKKNFEKFLEWLNGGVGDEKQMGVGKKIKYIIIAGDLVDGIGIYPSQKDELELTDIYKQYETFTEYIKRIPSHIKIIIVPGNHDAVRLAEPQPAIPKDLAPELYELENVSMLGNPSEIVIQGVRILIYHGVSIDEFVATVPGLGYDKGDRVMEEILKRRHLHPIYGKRPIAPEETDFMVIEQVPDILHMGHIHTNSYTNYRGVLCVNSGTWQARTPFQTKQGHQPTPCVLPVVNLKNYNISAIRFDMYQKTVPKINYTEEEEEEVEESDIGSLERA
jgi:DNA polymerase II small subunit